VGELVDAISTDLGNAPTNASDGLGKTNGESSGWTQRSNSTIISSVGRMIQVERSHLRNHPFPLWWSRIAKEDVAGRSYYILLEAHER
jgi:hypothetical protein